MLIREKISLNRLVIAPFISSYVGVFHINYVTSPSGNKLIPIIKINAVSAMTTL